MKAIKDKEVMPDLWYFVLAYLNETNFAPIRSRNICDYDDMGRPLFKMNMLDYATFVELVHEGVEWMLSKSEDLTLENIDKHYLK